MRRKILGVLICMLLIVTVFPAVTSENKNMDNSMIPTIQQIRMKGNWTEIQKLFAFDGIDNNIFGYSVSVSADTVLIGAKGDEPNGDNSGSAYVFISLGTNWSLQAKLIASDGAENDNFGFSVALYGDTALIGAWGDDNNGTDSGSAYVFVRTGTTWTQQAKLLASDGAANDHFGLSVSLDGDTALIGATGDNNLKGSAYVYTRTGTTWTQEQKLLASDGVAGDEFGYSVSIDDNTALIGAFWDDDNGEDSGTAFVFTRSGTTWTQQQKLLASDGAPEDYFGWCVSLDGDTALIGARFDDDNGVDSGSAYVFVRTGTTWTQQKKLVASDGAEGDSFGHAVDLSGDTIIIGAFFDDNSTGSAYVYTRTGTTWTQQQKLVASDGSTYDAFGYSVSLDENTALIGAIHGDFMKGSAYVFIKEIQNQPPNPPTITGPATGKIKVTIEYNFTSTDPDGENVYHFIDWGDGTNSSWIGPYTSGETITKSHTWTKKGTYTIKAKAKDVYGNESAWGQLSVTMPCSYNISMQWFWERLFERFPHAFPLLRHMMGY